ncbi:MAG: hypothetical protein GPI97_12375 [Microcystis aeruginosa W13-16]|nr:hypothetical protein [Microcystis aeruginosa W13-16]
MEKISKELLEELFEDSSFSTEETISQIMKIQKGEKVAVLGFDVLSYSQMTEPSQTLLPYLIRRIIKKTIDDLRIYEPCIFIDVLPKFDQKTVIDVGDGGFYFLPTPLHSVIFALYMEAVVRDFNANLLWKNLRSVVEPIKIRYALSYDLVFKYEDIQNHYGTGIINCARILAKDKLDRFLIDENSYLWFMKNIHGLESLKVIELEFLKFLPHFRNPNRGDNIEYKSFSIPEARSYDTPGIDNAFILKVGKIKSKENILSIYSVHLQMSYKYLNKVDTYESVWKMITVSLGNLNSMGLE